MMATSDVPSITLDPKPSVDSKLSDDPASVDPELNDAPADISAPAMSASARSILDGVAAETRSALISMTTEFQKNVERLESLAARATAEGAALPPSADVDGEEHVITAEAAKAHFVKTYLECLEAIDKKDHAQIKLQGIEGITLMSDVLDLKLGEVPYICSELNWMTNHSVLIIRIVTTFGTVIRAARYLRGGVDGNTKWRLIQCSPKHVRLASIYAVPSLIKVTKLDPYEDRELGSICRFIYACEGSYNRFKNHYTSAELVCKKDCDLVISDIIKLTDKRANTVALSHAARVVSCTVVSATKVERARLAGATEAIEVERATIIKERATIVKEREKIKAANTTIDKIAAQHELADIDLLSRKDELLARESEHQVAADKLQTTVAEFEAFKKAELDRLKARASGLDMRESVKTLAGQARLIAQELVEAADIFDYDPTAAKQKAAGVLQAAGALC